MLNAKLKTVLRCITTPKQRIYIWSLISAAKKLLATTSTGVERASKKTLADFETPYKLHLGCGNIHIPGYCNVDVMKTHGVDIIDDIRTLNKFHAGSAGDRYACHVLEHFAHDEIIPILKRWFEVLQPGGLLRISVPDIDKIVSIYSRNQKHFNTPGNSPWIGLIYGGQSTPYDFHKTGFNYCWLKYLLESCGYESCEEYAHVPHFAGNVVDASVANATFGEYFSLNVVAKKPVSNERNRV